VRGDHTRDCCEHELVNAKNEGRDPRGSNRWLSEDALEAKVFWGTSREQNAQFGIKRMTYSGHQ
jgi:hypothetical protein